MMGVQPPCFLFQFFGDIFVGPLKKVVRFGRFSKRLFLKRDLPASHEFWVPILRRGNGEIFQRFSTSERVDIVHDPQLLPRKLTWNRKMMVVSRNLLFQGFICRFHVSFRGCIPNYGSTFLKFK